MRVQLPRREQDLGRAPAPLVVAAPPVVTRARVGAIKPAGGRFNRILPPLRSQRAVAAPCRCSTRTLTPGPPPPATARPQVTPLGSRSLVSFPAHAALFPHRSLWLPATLLLPARLEARVDITACVVGDLQSGKVGRGTRLAGGAFPPALASLHRLHLTGSSCTHWGLGLHRWGWVWVWGWGCIKQPRHNNAGRRPPQELPTGCVALIAAQPPTTPPRPCRRSSG
jgi:hypothetical protein